MKRKKKKKEWKEKNLTLCPFLEVPSLKKKFNRCYSFRAVLGFQESSAESVEKPHIPPLPVSPLANISQECGMFVNNCWGPFISRWLGAWFSVCAHLRGWGSWLHTAQNRWGSVGDIAKLSNRWGSVGGIAKLSWDFLVLSSRVCGFLCLREQILWLFRIWSLRPVKLYG